LSVEVGGGTQAANQVGRAAGLPAASTVRLDNIQSVGAPTFSVSCSGLPDASPRIPSPVRNASEKEAASHRGLSRAPNRRWSATLRLE